MPRRRPRRRARELSRLRQGVAGHARVLRREGQSGAGSARRCWRVSARASTRPPSSRSSRRWPPARRPSASASATRSRRNATSRAPIALGVRLFAVDCEAEVEKIARAAPGSKVFCRILCDGAGAEWPLSRKFGCAPEMAARVLEHAHRAGPCRLRRLVPCRLAAAQSAHVGRRAEVGGGDLPRPRGARNQSANGQSRRRLSDQISQERAGGEDLRQRDLPRAVEAFRQPHSGDDHRAGPRHGRQRRRDRGGSRADLEEVGRRHGALGLSRHRQVQRPRRDARTR